MMAEKCVRDNEYFEPQSYNTVSLSLLLYLETQARMFLQHTPFALH